jgi:hypothetical protein
LPKRPGATLEVGLEPDDVERAARLGATGTLTVVLDELGKGERVIKLPVKFSRGGPPVLSFSLENGGVTRG